MKRRGIVKGQTIEFDHPLGLPDGQAVELDIRPLEGQNGLSPAAQAERKRQIGEALRQADEIRERIRKELGGELNLSVQYIREDRER